MSGPQTTLIVAISSYVLLIIAKRDVVARRTRHLLRRGLPVTGAVGSAVVDGLRGRGEEDKKPAGRPEDSSLRDDSPQRL